MTSFLCLIKTIEFSFCSRLAPEVKRKIYKVFILILTYVIYVSYHLSRKPISVVKNVLVQNCSAMDPPEPTNDTHWCDWAPFNGDNASTLLGTLDSAYLFAYAFGMFFSGMIAERMRLNVFLFIGMVASGIMTISFGFGYTFSIHVFWYYIMVQLICGLVQSTGWPGVVTVMGNWYGKSKRGLIMGIWNSHTSVGNILGTLIATAFLDSWGMSFIVPGIIILSLGILVLFILVPEPMEVDLDNPNSATVDSSIEHDEESSRDDVEIIGQQTDSKPISFLGAATIPNSSDDSVKIIGQQLITKPISFFGALAIPGVMEFAMSLFFSKLVSYTFLYWLPHFILDSTNSDASESGEISTFFDIGGIIGGILAGLLNDWTGMPASTCFVMLVLAIGMIITYQAVNSSLSLMWNMVLLIPVGLLVNGPYALITTAVTAELGTHSSLKGNAKALSTVSSIIDGTGSIGAAVGPLFAGLLTNNGNWGNVFYMMIAADVFSMLFLSRLIFKEVKRLMSRFR